jgi:phenylpyruvate tautomerase PptA (4-oxalocrotonate tautomerase family)
MATLTIDLRRDRVDARLRKLASALLDAVSRSTGEARDKVSLVIHESPGLRLVEGGKRTSDTARGKRRN